MKKGKDEKINKIKREKGKIKIKEQLKINQTKRIISRK